MQTSAACRNSGSRSPASSPEPPPLSPSFSAFSSAATCSSIDVPGAVAAAAAGACCLYHSIKRSVSSVEMNAPWTRIASLFPGGRNSMSPLPSDANRFTLPRREKQHVAVAEQRFRAVLIEDRATVDLCRDAECDAAREVRLDQPGDDVHGRPLRRENQVNADRARLLRQHRERCFD